MKPKIFLINVFATIMILFLFSGCVIKTSEVKKYFNNSCTSNNVAGCYEIGKLYEKGEKIDSSFLILSPYYSKMRTLGEAFTFINRDSKEISQDYKKAKEYYELSCNNNFSHACYRLGVLYEEGKGVKQNYTKAIKYYEKAWNLEDDYNYNNALDSYWYNNIIEETINGYYKLGVLHEEGKGVKQDYKKAYNYYRKSCYKGSVAACYRLGILHQEGRNTKKDYSLAEKYFSYSCNISNPFILYLGSIGCYELGNFYENGISVPQDNEKAFIYYKSSCHYKIEGCYKTGNLYYEGIGTKKDFIQAFEYYERSCKENYAKGCDSLAFMYETGGGVKIDYKKAKSYYKKSCDLGFEHACSNLSNLTKKFF